MKRNQNEFSRTCVDVRNVILLVAFVAMANTTFFEEGNTFRYIFPLIVGIACMFVEVTGIVMPPSVKEGITVGGVLLIVYTALTQSMDDKARVALVGAALVSVIYRATKWASKI